MDKGTAWHRGSIRTSHPAIPGSNLTADKKWNLIKRDLPRWNVCRQKSFTKKTNFAEKKPHFEAHDGEKDNMAPRLLPERLTDSHFVPFPTEQRVPAQTRGGLEEVHAEG